MTGDTVTGNGAGEADQVLGLGAPQHVGSFRFYFADERWEWSDAVAYMHGYQPGEVTPTTELLLSHKHPEDKPQVAAILDAVRRTGEPFSSRHRIIDTGGKEHMVVVVGDRMHASDGSVTGTFGFYIDVTESRATDIRESLDDTVAEITESRAVIDEAKGMLMVVYGISAERAFDVLRWRSQETNVKLRVIAEQLVRDVSLGVDTPKELRDIFDHLLLTAHERAARVSPAG